jgi:hypothetical protein
MSMPHACRNIAAAARAPGTARTMTSASTASVAKTGANA